MKKSYEEKYHELEDSHWWFLGRRDIIQQLVKPLPSDVRILEIGCSTGILIQELKSLGFSNVWGIDISEQAIVGATARGISQVSVGDAAATSFPDESFDVIISSDVLEHITDDAAAVREWERILKPNGLLIIFVPAHQFLWTSHDDDNLHKRRYYRRELIGVVQKSGLTLERVSYWNFLLFFPISAIRFLINLRGKRRATGNQLQIPPSVINHGLKYLLHVENTYIAAGYSLPIGVSLFCIARK
jgi:SAM-dependent methyltransferase